MKTTDILRDIMKRKEVKPSELAYMLGIKNNTLSERMTQKNMSILKLGEMLRAMGYKITIVPRNTRIPEDGYEVEFGDEEPKA